MSNWEARLGALMGDDYDYDHEILSPRTASKFVEILSEMPGYEGIDRGGHIYHRAWCPKEQVMADIQIDRRTGEGSYAYTGSEEIEP